MCLSNNNVRILVFGCLGLFIVLVLVLTGIIGYVVLAAKNAEQQVQSIYDSILQYPASDSVLEYTDFGSSNSIVCGMIWLESWRGANAPYADVQKYYDDEFAGRNWKRDASGGASDIFFANATTTITLQQGTFDNTSLLSPAQSAKVRAARENYQTLYLLRVTRLGTNTCL